jgi:hypothetical protein
LDPHDFWKPKELPDDFWGSVEAPRLSAALPRRLGNFPFWRGEAPLLESLNPVYAAAAPAGMDVFLGSPQHEEREEDLESAAPNDNAAEEPADSAAQDED